MVENENLLTKDEAQALFDQDSEKYKSRVAKYYFKIPRKGALMMPKVMLGVYFHE